MSHTVLEALQALTKVLRTASPSPEVESRLAELRRAATDQLAHETELTAQVERYQTILARALDVAATTSLGSVAGRVLDGMIEVTDARRGFVGLVDDHHRWSILVARTRDRGDITDPTAQLSRTIVTEMLAKGDAVVTFDARHDDDKPADSVVALDLRSVACLPLRWEGRTIGFVYLDDPGTRGLFDAAALTAVRAWVPLAAESVARALRHDGAGPGPLGVPTRSPRMLAGLESLARVAGFDVTVLLTGETGTGKTLLARKVHESSPRAAKPFVHVNCGAIPEALLEGELFGAEAGAYTDARALRIGRFEAADGGTLFLDEVTDLPLDVQARLLTFLQSREYWPVGATQARASDVRVIAATNTDIPARVREKLFREDLFYRLNVLPIRVPPLRERREDIPLLADALLRRYRGEGELPSGFTTETIELLGRLDWPGNVRELATMVQRGVASAQLYQADAIEVEHLMEWAPPTTGASSAREDLDALLGLRWEEATAGFEAVLIERAVAAAGGNITRAAEKLGVSRSTLYERRQRSQMRRGA